jgi:hypothetical protein
LFQPPIGLALPRIQLKISHWRSQPESTADLGHRIHHKVHKIEEVAFDRDDALHWLIQPHSGFEVIHPRTPVGRARGSAFDMSPVPTCPLQLAGSCCLGLLAPVALWNTTTSFTISRRWNSGEDPMFDQNQIQTIPRLCGLMSALICGMYGREKMKSDQPPPCTGNVHESLSTEMLGPAIRFVWSPLRLHH